MIQLWHFADTQRWAPCLTAVHGPSRVQACVEIEEDHDRRGGKMRGWVELCSCGGSDARPSSTKTLSQLSMCPFEADIVTRTGYSTIPRVLHRTASRFENSAATVP
eukprot:4703264-Amphidinium_carterae.1